MVLVLSELLLQLIKGDFIILCMIISNRNQSNSHLGKLTDDESDLKLLDTITDGDQLG